MTEEKCQNCRYWTGKPHHSIGNCRRYPPTVVYCGDGDTDTQLPITKNDESCGEFQVKEG